LPELTIVADTSFGPASIFDGIGLGLYDIGIFKGARSAQALEALPKKVSIVGEKLSSHALKSIKQLIKASALTRMLQDAPANWLTPERFATIAADVSKELSLKCTILGRAELEALGAGSFLSVGAGSSGEPRLIAIEIPGVNSSETVALIGKGLTFDTGGNSLKPALGMGEMKYDMSGGAAVLGAACYLAKEKPRCRVICLIGAVENMPGPTATRPGDVVVAMNGKTIDVQNTDAEGRLVLADLLHYANVHYKPTLMVDIATLTGAVLHALGHAGAGLMSNDQSTADRVVRVAKEQGEPFWQLPLWPELEKETKGECSDLQNIAKPNVLAGTIMGGMFLAEFVGQTKWVHLDIAGTGWSCKATGFPSVGGSSFGLRTLAALCL
jgi:leucyl aminopeptidase